jgi:hypothetical protein
MFGMTRTILALLTVLTLALCVGSPATAQEHAREHAWRVSKTSGDVSISTARPTPAALARGMVLHPGDKIHTGQNGRVLLERGKETILISANSIIGIPEEKKDGLPTTILQQAGSILLEVEKRGVNHFEVETPHLSAVVKGTRFHVTVNANDSRVGVFRGQVEVLDFKSGQYALIHPGQTARVSARGGAGLSVTGTGALSPIRQGTPRRSSVSSDPALDQGHRAPDQGPSNSREARTPTFGATDASASMERTASQLGSWDGDFYGEDGRALNARRHGENLTLAFPLMIGGIVSIVVAVRRRRQRLKQERALPGQ